MVMKPNILKSKRSFFSKLDIERSVVGASLSLSIFLSLPFVGLLIHDDGADTTDINSHCKDRREERGGETGPFVVF